MDQIWDRKFPIPNLSHFRHNIKPNTLRMYKNVYLLCLIHPVMIYHGLWVVCSNLPKYDFLRGDVWTYPFKERNRGSTPRFFFLSGFFCSETIFIDCRNHRSLTQYTSGFIHSDVRAETKLQLHNHSGK